MAGAGSDPLYDVIAIIGLHRIGYLSVFEGDHRILEGLDHPANREPPEVSALRGTARVFGILGCELGEVLASFGLFGNFIGEGLVLDQNMSGIELRPTLVVNVLHHLVGDFDLIRDLDLPEGRDQAAIVVPGDARYYNRILIEAFLISSEKQQLLLDEVIQNALAPFDGLIDALPTSLHRLDRLVEVVDGDRVFAHLCNGVFRGRSAAGKDHAEQGDGHRCVKNLSHSFSFFRLQCIAFI